MTDEQTAPTAAADKSGGGTATSGQRKRSAQPLAQRDKGSEEKKSGSRKNLFYCADPRHAGNFADESRFFEVDKPDEDDEPEHTVCPLGHVHHYGPLKEREIPPHLVELDQRLNQPSGV